MFFSKIHMLKGICKKHRNFQIPIAWGLKFPFSRSWRNNFEGWYKYGYEYRWLDFRFFSDAASRIFSTKRNWGRVRHARNRIPARQNLYRLSRFRDWRQKVIFYAKDQINLKDQLFCLNDTEIFRLPRYRIRLMIAQSTHHDE